MQRCYICSRILTELNTEHPLASICQNCSLGILIESELVKTHDIIDPRRNYKMKSKAPKDTEKEKKPDASLIPLDLLIDFLVPAYEEGIKKYYRDSWREGFTTTHMIGALLRHLSEYEKGEDFDPDTLEKFGIKKHHLGAILFCVLCLCDTYENHPELDDRRHLIKKEQILKSHKSDELEKELKTIKDSVSFKDHLKESEEKIKKWEIYKQDILGGTK